MHATNFYKSLFGSNGESNIILTPNFWDDRSKISQETGESHVSPFSKEEVREAIFGMKSHSAPGPNGFGAEFFKSFWQLVKNDYMAMFDDFHQGRLDIKRLNFGVITLIPKVTDAVNIKQYRPICLLNVDYKGFTKVLTNRFSTMAGEVIGDKQTDFMKERNILEGVVILHEVIHELSHSKKRGLILKIDFEKAYCWVESDPGTDFATNSY